MKIVHIETLIDCGTFTHSDEWSKIQTEIHSAIRRVDWPHGTGTFSIYPQSGKKHGQGNGVRPIKESLMIQLRSAAWSLERYLDISTRHRPGKVDAALETSQGLLVLEWETGNISSSHRAINKMALGLLKEVIVAGMLVVPSRSLYKYLTDRIGNWDELVPYIDLWKSIPIQNGLLQIVVVEQDEESIHVPRIPKSTDGMALM